MSILKFGFGILLGFLPAFIQLPAQVPGGVRAIQVRPTAQQSVPRESRVALVIGNGAYAEAPLRNPVNDARAMASALRDCGFQVDLVLNANRAKMFQAVRDFGQQIGSGGVGLFYFAGHGMAVKGVNYLIPVATDITREDEVEVQALTVQSVLNKMEAANNRLNLLILDACRTNPFGRDFRGGAGGLAQMDAPMGTYIAFATAPGRTAADGNGTNGLYTQKILTYIRTPGLSLEGLFKRVRTDVVNGSGGQQVPWDSSSLMGDFFFMPIAKGAPNTAVPVIALASEPLASLQPQNEIIATNTKAQGRPEMAVNLGNGKQMILVQMPAGSFMMGSDIAKPIHKVTISRDFWIGKYPVTEDQWESVMCCNPSDFKGINLPVENVSWDDCQKFISELNTRGLGTFRLPTEAEWEYACRADSTGHYYANPDDIAWYRKNNGGTPHPVGQKQPNNWGLYDMSGSVRQWCQDWAKFYPSEPQTDPQGPSTGMWRVNRGGTWDGIYVCPSDERNYNPPNLEANYMGLRLVRNEP